MYCYSLDSSLSEDYLAHYGILGMKWGVKRYQNADGTLTPKGEKKYYEKRTNKLSKSGKRLQSIVRDTASKNVDILKEYDEESNKLKSTKTNEHARKLINDINKKYDAYKKSKEEYEKTGSVKNKRSMELKYIDYEDSLGTLESANRRDADRLYYKYKQKLAEKTLEDLGSQVTDRGRYFVETLIGDYYKNDLD